MHFCVAAKHRSRVHSTPSSQSASPTHSQLERSRTQRPLSHVAVAQSASFGPRQSTLRAHWVPPTSVPLGSGPCTSGCRIGSGSAGVDFRSASGAGVGGRLEVAFLLGGGFRATSGSSRRRAPTAMTKPRTTSPSARSHQIFRFLSDTTASLTSARDSLLHPTNGATAGGGPDVRTCRASDAPFS